VADTDTPQEGSQLVDENDETPTDDDTPTGEPESTPDEAVAKQISDLRRENASWRTKLRQTEAELEKIRESAQSDQESALAQAREEARREAFQEALAEANSRILRAEVIAAASRKLADPEDAVRLLDLDSFHVDDNGEVDRAALAAAVDELVKAKPYLAGARDPDFGARPPAQPAGQSMDDLIRSAARRP